MAVRCLIGVVFAVSAFTKLRGGDAFRAFVSWVESLPVFPALTAGRGPAVAAAMAATEAAVVVAVAVPASAVAGLLLAAALLAVFAAGSLVVARRGNGVPCRCFGASSVPLGRRHVVRDAVLAVAAAAGAVCAGAGAGAVRPAGVALSVGVAATAAILVLFLDDLVDLTKG